MWNKIIYKPEQKIGNALYLRDAISNTAKRKAIFKCKCGNEFIADIYKVKTFETNSCGCFHSEMTAESNSTHQLSKHPLYAIWKSMKARCYNKTVKQYKDYGGKGVTICIEWLSDFKSFYDWAITNGWQKGLQLDKDIKGTGLVYSPENCLFVTPKENSNKRITNKLIFYNGETKTVSQWADYFSISVKNLYQRLSRGASFENSIGNG